MRALTQSMLVAFTVIGCTGGDAKQPVGGDAPDAVRDLEDTGDDTGDHSPPTERPFQMGFTPFPYEATWEGLTGTYGLIHEHGDFVAHHFDGGVPWPEALTGADYPAAVAEEIDMRLALTDPLAPAYVALSPLSIGRDDLAPGWGEELSMERTGEWADASFADADVRTAYANFAVHLIDRFQPTWFNYAIEASDFLVHKPEQWDAFVGFAQHVHYVIREAHPDVQLMISIAMKHPDSPAAETIRARFADLLPYVDVVGLSVYPYAFFGLTDGGNPANLPESWISQVSDIAPDHPIAIAETAWIAEDLSIDAGAWSLNVESSAEWQADYVEALCLEASALDAQFITWWAVTDFDTLWEETLASDPLAAIWRDAGLYDGDVTARPALDVWESWRAKPLAD